ETNKSKHVLVFFFSSRRRHTKSKRDWSSDVCSSNLKTDKNVQMYFNYHKALLPLKKGVAITTKMANLIPNTMTCKKLLIEGEFSRINSLTAIKNQAIRLNINGYVNLQDDKVIEIIALCNDKSFQQLKSVILEFEN